MDKSCKKLKNEKTFLDVEFGDEFTIISVSGLSYNCDSFECLLKPFKPLQKYK